MSRHLPVSQRGQSTSSGELISGEGVKSRPLFPANRAPSLLENVVGLHAGVITRDLDEVIIKFPDILGQEPHLKRQRSLFAALDRELWGQVRSGAGLVELGPGRRGQHCQGTCRGGGIILSSNSGKSLACKQRAVFYCLVGRVV